MACLVSTSARDAFAIVPRLVGNGVLRLDRKVAALCLPIRTGGASFLVPHPKHKKWETNRPQDRLSAFRAQFLHQSRLLADSSPSILRRWPVQTDPSGRTPEDLGPWSAGKRLRSPFVSRSTP